ncbi:MAG: flagellar motor protein MotA, partial [Hyphomicrobiaceae bacterium]
AFSSSLLGLSGSLVLGFLELQASHAHNRFYNELEEWLSGITELTPGDTTSGSDINRQLYGALFEVQRGIAEISDRLTGSGDGAGVANETMQELASGVSQLVNQMRAEQNIVRQWVDEQATQNQEVATALKDLAAKLPARRS